MVLIIFIHKNKIINVWWWRQLVRIVVQVKSCFVVIRAHTEHGCTQSLKTFINVVHYIYLQPNLMHEYVADSFMQCLLNKYKDQRPIKHFYINLSNCSAFYSDIISSHAKLQQRCKLQQTPALFKLSCVINHTLRRSQGPAWPMVCHLGKIGSWNVEWWSVYDAGVVQRSQCGKIKIEIWEEFRRCVNNKKVKLKNYNNIMHNALLLICILKSFVIISKFAFSWSMSNDSWSTSQIFICLHQLH